MTPDNNAPGEERPEHDDPVSAKMAALGDSVAVLQSVLGTATKDLLTTLSSNLSMMRSMNAMMDQHVQQSVSIKSWITSPNSLRLRIENRSSIALKECQTSLIVMSTDAERHPIRFTLTGPDSGRFREDDADCSWKAQDMTDLEPGNVSSLELEFDRFEMFARYNAVIRVTFTSPGSGNDGFL
ncbi:hypothetical protein BVRB_029690 [Beta vulgaris subsp. vulgaris]|uniref:Uncharacterized protein n=1 Tax=Beta vulgaris subsp. vulgaris TaxID=3555 RepID=A0A0J8DSA8_BETVV|nr:hypothetical protein BVRB_029690 [Beta vulgaris subsp. vulgaris]